MGWEQLDADQQLTVVKKKVGRIDGIKRRSSQLGSQLAGSLLGLLRK